MQALGGAKNHMVVLPDADLDLAADAAVNAGYGTAGERCMAISVLVAVEPVADELVARIAERTRTLRIGDGADAARRDGRRPTWARWSPGSTATRSPASSTPAQRAGAKVVVDGRDVAARGGEEAASGSAPRSSTTSPPTWRSTARRSSGRCCRWSASRRTTRRVALVNANQYGNGTAIFTNDGGAARRFEDDVEVGMIGINVPIPVPVAYYSFGGWKRSLFGDTHAHGTEGVHFFTRGKVVTTRWIDPAARPEGGLELGFPQND